MDLKLEDLQMYKDGYKNIAMQINELNIIDNETEIKRLEEVVNENQAEIEKWEVHDKDQKKFEEYARPYNEIIREAEAKIVQLEQGKEENKKQQEENKKQQKQMKVHMDNVRKNAENYYNEARKNLEQAWENSEQKKQYDSKKEMLEMLNSRENRTAAESGAIIRLAKEIRDIKQAHLNDIKAIDDEYKDFLQDLDTIDNEYGINKLEELAQTPGAPVPGTPAPRTPAQGTPVQGTPTPGAPAPGTPAPRTPAQGTPVQGTPTPGAPAPGTPAPGTPAPGTPAPRTPAQGTPVQGTPTPGTPVQGTLKGFKIEVTKDGSRFVIMRDGEEEPQAGDWNESYEAGEHLENIAFEEENKLMLQSARNVGDKFVVNEIVLAVTSKKITPEEGKKILDNYLKALKGNDMKDSPFELEYKLKGLSRSGIDKDQKNYIIQKAKEAKKLEKTGNIIVKPGFFRTIGWGLEKLGTKLNLWNKNKALPEGLQSKVIVTSEMVEKQSTSEMDRRKQLMKERLRATGKVSENQNLGQGLNKALREQDKIKQDIDEGR